MIDELPPGWAEAWLRSLLPPRDRETVSGDLLEEYRVNIRPHRSRFAASRWYFRQVAAFAWRTAAWACVLAAIFISRTASDWFVPTNSIAGRSGMTTLFVASVWLVIGASSALRTRSVVAATVTTATAVTLAAVLCTIAATVMYALWHDAATMRAIDASEGLAEVYSLPIVMIVPATMVGWTGALLASVRYRWRAR